MRYNLIAVQDREIFGLGIFETNEEAYEKMKDDVKRVLLNNEDYTEEEFNNDEGRDNEWGLEESSAWVNGNYGYFSDYDWRILGF